MRILVINHEYPPLGGGASPVTGELASKLAEAGHTIDIVTMGFRGLKNEQTKNLSVYRVKCFRKKKESCNTFEMFSFLPFGLLKALLLCAQNKYDLIHCHFIIPGGAIAVLVSFLFRIPLVITSHGSDVPGYNPDRFGLGHRLTFPAWKYIAKRAHMITAPSQFQKRLIQGLVVAKVTVIPNGINFIRFSGEKKKQILFAGKLQPRKGADILIRACKGVNWPLMIAGEGPERPTLERLTKDLEVDAHFLGWLGVEELSKVYSSSAIFVSASSVESFGMSLVEAMMHGIACIAIEGTACAEVIGKAGLLVRRNPESIRKALLELIRDESKLATMQREALRRAEFFDWKNILPKYLDLFNHVLVHKNGK